MAAALLSGAHQLTPGKRTGRWAVHEFQNIRLLPRPPLFLHDLLILSISIPAELEVPYREAYLRLVNFNIRKIIDVARLVHRMSDNLLPPLRQSHRAEPRSAGVPPCSQLPQVADNGGP